MPIPIPYDIFKKDSHGVPVWVEAVPDLESAPLRVVELDKQEPGGYMIFCYMTQELISAAPRTAYRFQGCAPTTTKPSTNYSPTIQFFLCPSARRSYRARYAV